MAQSKLVLFSVVFAGFSPVIASLSDLPLAVIFSAIMCILLWLQELLVIQIDYKQENIKFTRRFKEKYPGATGVLYSFLPHILSLIIVIYILLEIGGGPSLNGWIVLICSFFTLVRIFDPLLGCISTYEPISWNSMIAYVIIFSFAISSAIDPSKLDFYPFPSLVTEFILLVVISYTVLNLRLAYYFQYCFSQEQSLQMQLKLVLIPLSILSLHQVLTIFNSVDFSSILGG